MSTGFQKVYETNKYEALINNDFNFNSFDYISNEGIVSDYSLLLKNFNSYSENSTVYEKKNDHEIFGTLLLKSELPLKKELENSTNFLKPIFQLRVSPTNGKNISSSDTRIEFDNLFSPNRIGRSDMVEKGNSVTLGIEFEKQKLDDINKYFEFLINAKDAKANKPDIIHFKLIKKYLPDIDFDEILHVGDCQVNDMLGASYAGMKTLWFNKNNEYWGQSIKKPPEFDDWKNFTKILGEIGE